jgi:hypothetical protein
MPESAEIRRFSQLYLERGTPLRDSERMRTRLHGFFQDYLKPSMDERALAALVRREIGIIVESYVYDDGYNWSKFFVKAQIRDVLDGVSLIRHELVRTGQRNLASNWCLAAERVMREENLGYRVDAAGVVHLYVDKEFDRNRVAAIGSLVSRAMRGLARGLKRLTRRMIAIRRTAGLLSATPSRRLRTFSS